MPILTHEINNYFDQFGLHDIASMPTTQYRQALAMVVYCGLIIMILFVARYQMKSLQQIKSRLMF